MGTEMNEIWLLTKVDFDCLENREPKYSTEIGLFTSEEAALKYFKKIKGKEYKGYDKETYPQTKLKKLKILG
jgi:hypothetical protein